MNLLCIGYGCFLSTGKLINGLVFETEAEAQKRADESFFDLQVSPVYVEVAES